MQKPYEVLKGITLPGKNGVVVSRIYNWLRELNEDVRPSSCKVITQYDANFSKFFLEISTSLAESAGVNIVISDQIQSYFEQINTKHNSNVRVIYFERNPERIDKLASQSKVEIYRIADSLRMKSELTKNKFPRHISIFKAFELSYELSFGDDVPVVFDFSDVREPDEVSSGKDSFIEVCKQINSFALKPNLSSYLKVLSDICSTIKRGGFRRHGALTSTIKSNHPLVDEYLSIPFGFLSHLKKGISMRAGGFDHDTLVKVCNSHSRGELFLEKEFGFSGGVELWTNVCRGLSLIPGDRCLVSPVNLGQAQEYSDILKGFKEVTHFLVAVDQYQRDLGEYLPDKQIAVGMTGLANCLRNFNTDYYKFIEALIVFNRNINPVKELLDDPAWNIVNAIFYGCHIASQIGVDAGMRAVLAIEPTASSSRRVKDWQGYDIAPNIDPPNVVPGIGIERRHSETGVFDFEGKKIHPEFNYGADIFPASYLTYEQHFTLWNEMQKLMNSAGKPHCGSYECWGELTIERFYQWFDSDLKTIYYNKTIGTKHLEKGRQVSARLKIGNNQQIADDDLKSTDTPQCLVNDLECASCD